MPNIFNKRGSFEQAFSEWTSAPYENWKDVLTNSTNALLNSVNQRYAPPQGSGLVDNYNINRNPKWPRASYDDLSKIDEYSFLSDLHAQGNQTATNILSKKLWDLKNAQFDKELPDKIKNLSQEYRNLGLSDADSPRDWYEVGASPEEMKAWDDGSKLARRFGLGALASVYTTPFLFKGLKQANRFLNLKTASKLRGFGWNKTARFLNNYGVADATLDLGFTGSLATDVLKGNSSPKDLAIDLGITGTILARKPIWKGLKWVGSKLKPISPIMMSPILMGGTKYTKDDKVLE